MATKFSGGFLFHTTSPVNLLKILRDGYLAPFLKIGNVSFTRDPFLGGSVSFIGFTIVFPERVIIEKYGGREIEPEYYPREEEVAVIGRRVYISDALEILSQRDAARKYGFGHKYPYKDIRKRLGPQWEEFRKYLPPSLPIPLP